MKKYIKDNKVYTLPITIKSKKEIEEEIINDNGEKEIVKKVVDVLITTNDEKTILAAGYDVYVPPKPSLEVLIERSNRLINQETDRKILNDFTWNGEEFYLTMENQFNFKTMYDMRDYKEFPITIKTKSGFTQLEDMAALSGFYFAGVEFVENCLKEGWTKKAEEEEKIRESYK